MVCNKCYETTKNDNLLYGLRLTEINFINEEISAQQLHIISIFECKNQYRECVLSILNYVPHFTRHKIKNATDLYKLVDCLEKCLICRHIRRFAD